MPSRYMLRRYSPPTRILPALAAAFCAAGPPAILAQQLWTVEEVATRPISPVAPGAPAMSRSAAGAPGPIVAETASVQVELDYLRMGFGYLELPLADGSVIEAENAVFEDRGAGNLLWTGKAPGAGYESVLFTVQDGHLAGWLGAPGRPTYTVHAGPDGRGTLGVDVRPFGDWCGTEADPRGDQARGEAATTHRPQPAVSEQNDGRLDILLLYSERTARWWRNIGGPAAGVQQLSDYLNMAFRNGAIPATAKLIPVQWTPERAPHPNTKGGHYQWNGWAKAWHHEFNSSPAVEALKMRHRPDLVHFIASVPDGYAIGVATLRRTLDPVVLTGWSMPFPGVFAHEIGHNLGGNHEPATFPAFARAQSDAVRPWAFGHSDLTSCESPHDEPDGLLRCPHTIMSYGSETWRDPGRESVRQPFYSSVRHKPNGWTIGIAAEREVERVLHETVPVSLRNSEAARRVVRYPREMTVHWSGRDEARVAWEGPFGYTEPGGNFVCFALAGGGRPECRSAQDLRAEPFIGGLRPGGRYRFWFFRQEERRRAGTYDGVAGDLVELGPPDFNGRAPAAPTNVVGTASGQDGVRLGWRGESPAGGFEIWCRKWSRPSLGPPTHWERCGAPLSPRARSAEIDSRVRGTLRSGAQQRLVVAEEEITVTDGYWDHDKDVWVEEQTAKRGRYSFVVVAHNDSGFSASETLDYEFMPGPFPPPTATGEVPDCALRSSGLELDGFEVEVCVETPAGERRRAWNHELEADRSGLLYFFDRDNAEILVKVLDGCAINGHRWVFVAPVTTLAFRLQIRELGPYLPNRRQVWYYASDRRPQDEIRYETVGNPKDRTARTVSDTTAFPCTVAEIAAAKAASADNPSAPGFASFDGPLTASTIRSLSAGSTTNCEPLGTALTLDGYRVSMCYETYAGETGDARDWGLDSSRSGLLYFFERSNAEVLIKVLDGCGVNGHRWVFVAPVTDLAFNLQVKSPAGEVWTHRNALGQTAESASDTAAFPCGLQ